jgi:hypothetical protein
MNTKYPVYQVDEAMVQQSPRSETEGQGRLRKVWIFHPELGTCLFKESNFSEQIMLNYQTDWSEKVAYELAKLIGIPTTRYEFSVATLPSFSREEIRGVLTPSYHENNCVVLNGEFFMNRFSPGYIQHYPGSYNVQSVLAAMNAMTVASPLDHWVPIDNIKTGSDIFTGYLLFDSWIGNQDRHSCNFEILAKDDHLELLPSFDHGNSLGAIMTNERRIEISPQEYMALLPSAFWTSEMTRVKTSDVFGQAASLMPAAAAVWIEKLSQIQSSQIQEIFDRIPEDRVAEDSLTFAQKLLNFNQKRLTGQLV